MGDLEINTTSIGPVTKETRDQLKSLRDQEGCANYNETLDYLLDLAETEC